jgi:hypothetical protein
MKYMVVLLVPFILTACGAGETVGVAAVEATAKAQEIKAGKKLEADTKAQLEQSMAAGQKNLEDAEAANH